MPVIGIVAGRPRDLGGFGVARVLPSPQQRSVGPFVFFDEMGPADFAAGAGIDVRPHPHIGLATVTYLFDGGLTHRDSLGTVIDITPGAVNWMTAGRGITHSERSPAGLRAAGHRMHGIQAWVALPVTNEEDAPSFAHHPADTLPSIVLDGARRTLIAGAAFQTSGPVAVASPLFYIDVEADAGAGVWLPADHEERAVYVASGTIEIEGATYEAGRMMVFEPGKAAFWQARTPVRAMLLGGAKLDGDRHLEWNFVSHSAERIETAKADWRAGRFPMVPGEDELIPLPPEPAGLASVARGGATS